MGFLQSYVGEGAVYGRHLASTRKSAKIAVLYEKTPLGTDMTKGLERWIRGKGPQVVAKQSYELTDTDVSAQVAQLRSSGADTLMLFATPKFAIQALRRRAPARLEAAGLRRIDLDRAEHHGDRAAERARADEGRPLGRVREEPERPDLAQGSRASRSTARS